jgi:hypothetical protein
MLGISVRICDIDMPANLNSTSTASRRARAQARAALVVSYRVEIYFTIPVETPNGCVLPATGVPQ